MSKFYIVNAQVKSNAIEAVRAIQFDSNMMIEIKKRTRSIAQNDKMWAMLTELSEQVSEYHGIKMSKDDYRDLFTGSLKGMQFVPAIGEVGKMVAIGGGSSKLTTAQMSDLIMMIEVYGAERNVKFKDMRYD